MTQFFSLVGAIAIGAAAMWLLGKNTVPPPPLQPPLMLLEQMGHWVTVKVNYANIIEFTEKITQDIPWTQWELRLGGTKVLLVARGDCLVGTDLRAAKYLEVDKDKRTAVLLLPEPKTLSARVNHDPQDKGGSYFYAINSTGIEPIIPGSTNRSRAIDAALRAAQDDITRTCGSPDVLATAKKNSETMLLLASAPLGWKIDIRWAP